MKAGTLRFWPALLAVVAGSALAQGYPSQPIRLIVPWPPGGGVDTSARIVAQPLGARLGQNIVIENRPGAAGNIGTEAASKAKADGYTLLMGSSSPNAINVHLYSRLGFDPVKDFVPIGFVTSVPNILVVPGNSPHSSGKGLLEFAKTNPGKLNYGSAGGGSSQPLPPPVVIPSTRNQNVHLPDKGTPPPPHDPVGGLLSVVLH